MSYNKVTVIGAILYIRPFFLDKNENLQCKNDINMDNFTT